MATNYIDRNALIEHIRKDPLFDLVEQYGITGVIESFPAADVQPVKHGKWKHVKWVKDDEEQAGGYWISRCSNCIMPYHSETPYCPHCGAKMDGET